ncbi:MAG: fibronectin type III domain-containing protein, partial [Elusimicrobiota bacterium]
MPLFWAVSMLGQEIVLPSGGVRSQALDQAGSGDISTPSHRLNVSLGEVAISSFGSSGSSLLPGLMQQIAAPGTVSDLGGVAGSSVSVRLTWQAPGYDGGWGALQSGTAYHVQHSTWAGISWSRADAQVSISTQAVWPGDAQSAPVSGLWPNTTNFFRLWTQDAFGNLSALSNGATVATLARLPQPGAQPFRMVGVSSVAVAWGAFAASPSSMTAEGYRLEACADADFAGDILSSQTFNAALSTLTVSGLFSDTTYYFRVAALNWNRAANYALAGSTLTRPSVDVAPPTAVTDLSASTASATAAWLRWSAPADPGNEPWNGTYAIQRATYATGVEYSTAEAQVSFTTANVAAASAQSRLVSGLYPNTTHFFRIWSADAKPNWSPLSNGATVATLADLTAGVRLVSVATGGIGVGWEALPLAPSSATAEGYRLEVSSTGFGVLSPGGQLYSSATSHVSLSTLAISGLQPNTTYFYRVASLNWLGRPNYSAVAAVSTLADPAAALAPGFLAVNESSATVRWAALPAGPSSATCEGYRLEASSTDFGALAPGGLAYSSATAQVRASTLTVQGLDPNTIYYYRVASLNWSGTPHYTILSATSTLARAPDAPSVSEIMVSSAVLSWLASEGGAAGYRMAASSTGFDGSGEVVYASAGSGQTSLAVPGLQPNTTYSFRVGAVNWDGAAAYAAAGDSSTYAQAPGRLATDFFAVYSASVSARWAALPVGPASATCEGYRLEASSTDFGALAPGGLVYSSATAQVRASTLTVSGLDANTVYYYRAASLNWSGAARYAMLSATSTLARAPVSAASTFTAAANVYLTAQWTAGGNPDWTQYRLQLSTASDFTGDISQSAGPGLAGSVYALLPNTTYYGRVAAVNNDGLATAFTALGATSTWASMPSAAAPDFAPVYFSSLTLNFSAGDPANPQGTVYEVQISSCDDFNVYQASATRNDFAVFQGLAINAAYYGRVRARSHSGLFSDFYPAGSTATLSVRPGPVASTYSNVTANSFSMTWASGTALSGYNPDGTTYSAEISTAGDFTGTILENMEVSTETVFSGLVSGTVYYARVRSANQQNAYSAFTSYGSVTTLNSAAPSFLNGTFYVSDSLGQYLSPDLYTDTTTPKLSIQVQSNYTPGLAVADTPSQLALWHLDEGAGASGSDASRHSRSLALGGAPAPGWTEGKLGAALDFDGTQNYAVSANLTPWRASAADSQFTVSLWCNTTLGKG